MATVKRKSTVPYYAVGGTWLLYAALFPLYRPMHFILVAAVSCAVFLALRGVCPDVEEQVEAVLDGHGIVYDKTEVWIAEERLYEVLYSMEVLNDGNEQEE